MADEPEDEDEYVENWDVDLYSVNPETGDKTHVAEGEHVYNEPTTRRGKEKRRFERLRWWLPW